MSQIIAPDTLPVFYTPKGLAKLSDLALRAYRNALRSLPEDYDMPAGYPSTIETYFDSVSDALDARKEKRAAEQFLTVWGSDTSDYPATMSIETGADTGKSLAHAIEGAYYGYEDPNPFTVYALTPAGVLVAMTLELHSSTGWTSDDYRYDDYRLSTPDGSVILEFYTRIDGRA